MRIPSGSSAETASSQPAGPAAPSWRAAAGYPATLLAGVVSGVVTALAFPPADVGPLAFVSLVPLALVFRATDGPKGWRRAGVAGLGFGAVFFALLLPWIHLFGLAAYLLLVGLETVIVAAGLVAGVALRRSLPGDLKVLAFPAAMLAGEFVRSHVPLGGFPWGGLGYSQHNDAAVLHLAAYTGVWGVGFLVALVNALVAEAVAALRRSPARALVQALARALALLVGAGALAVAPILLPVTTPQGAALTVGLVQRAPPDPGASAAAQQAQSQSEEAALTEAMVSDHPGIGLVVWPESSYDVYPLAEDFDSAPLVAAIQSSHAWFVIGASLDASEGTAHPRFRNESLFFAPDGSIIARYVKLHLVPFGEYVPARRLLAGWIHELDRVPADGIAGTEATVFSLPQGRVASVICYETAYPELVGAFVAKGARMIVVSTNNSSYGRSAASAQMVAISQLRAAEQRMWVAQAALTGISAVIDPSGRVVERTGLFTSATLVATVRLASGRSPYGVAGDWLPALVLLGGAAWTVAGAVRGEGSARAA